jgi:2-polyprenyl-3-methyl-5-hydroxy-6-metoxy-1,4-benzoquinol methylase
LQAELPKSAKIEAFFHDPDVYLKNNFMVAVRSILVREMLGEVRGARILDAGCGDGSISRQFLSQGNEITLVDLSAGMLERAMRQIPPEYQSHVQTIHGDVLGLDGDEAYDLLLCIGVLAHVESVEATVAKVSRLLRPGGRCVLQITNSNQGLGALLHAYCSARAAITGTVRYSLNRTTLRELLAVAEQHSLECLTMRKHVLLLPGMGRLPSSWLREYDLRVARSRRLSRFGASALVLFRKRVS